MNARVVLWAVTTPPNAYPRFEEKARDFPLDYSHGEVQASGVMTGADGGVLENCELEPSECVESEVLFCFDPLPELMAMRASIEQEQTGRAWPRFWQAPSEVVTWEPFAYLDPDVLTGPQYVALTSHEANE
jgi:hypothetical protein